MTIPILESLKKRRFTKKILLEALCLRGADQDKLFRLARFSRDQYFPEKTVEIRSVIEISNVCRERCSFCNMNLGSKIPRYTASPDLSASIVDHLYRTKQRRVFLLQSGENPSRAFVDNVAECVSTIKTEHSDAVVILCLGNLSDAQYKQLLDAGTDRYIIKFETSNPRLYKRIKPSDTLAKRIKCLRSLARLGFEVGSGNIVGLPGQTINDLINDLLFLGKLPLSMMSTSVFIPGEKSRYRDNPPGDMDTTLNFMALTRIMYPHAIIPSTSSLETGSRGGQHIGLMAGANALTVHDGTPVKLKDRFPIYSVHRFNPDYRFIRSISRRTSLRLWNGPIRAKK
jgi:biotin synthase